MSTQRQAAGAVKAGDKVGGQWAALERAEAVAPPAAGGATDQFADIRKDYWADGLTAIDEDGEYFDALELGLEHYGVITAVNVRRDAETGEASLTVDMREDSVSGGALTQEQFDRGYLHLHHSLQERYDAESIECNDDANVTFQLYTPLGKLNEVNAGMAADIAYERTKMIDFVNETDAGTCGSEYFYTDVQKGIDEGFFPGKNPETGRHEPEVRERVQRSASAAAAIIPEGSAPQLTMLAERGYCTDADAALGEVSAAGGAALRDAGMAELFELLRDEDSRRIEAEQAAEAKR
ncbi:hypothetical protein [Leucobacter sp. cx-169]|uniref:hypothetical protein n=1 Tax=Leucobacter sp. cx-169 TaxID=2770549 RepID=UPI00165E2DBA|nr:hypothetical protein [Leucobacter sp. cx-169]MBC9927373.1 hypothetical protein [Leucobacter sp. cx-169]